MEERATGERSAAKESISLSTKATGLIKVSTGKHYKRLSMKRKEKVLDRKIRSFNSEGTNLYNVEYTIDDVILKFGPKPKCYLSGIEFDLYEGNYHLDHVFPKARGGTNSLDNMEVMYGPINLLKSDGPFSAVLCLCRDILIFQGCTVTRPPEIYAEYLLKREKEEWANYQKMSQGYVDPGEGI